MSRQPFWMVKGAGPTNCIHATEAAAVTEAARLAEANPGQEFHVLKSVATCRKTTVQWTQHEEQTESVIPF